MESSYATSNEMRSNVAVGTAERGLSHPSLLPRLGIVPLPHSGVDHMRSLNTVNKFFYARLWRFRGLLCASSHLLQRMRAASLAACIPSSQ
jgi:hypothetical protein